MQIFRGPPTHMPPVTSNHGSSLPNHETSTVENKGFQMVSLPYSSSIGAIYTNLDHFRPHYVKSGDRV